MTSMTFDEFAKKYGSNGEDKGKSNQRTLDHLHQAAVKAQYLTGSEYWDTYLSYLQADIETVELRANELIERLAFPTTINYEEVIGIKLKICRLQSYADALKMAMALPIKIINDGMAGKDTEIKNPGGTD